jgi:hypothetical protein
MGGRFWVDGELVLPRKPQEEHLNGIRHGGDLKSAPDVNSQRT